MANDNQLEGGELARLLAAASTRIPEPGGPSVNYFGGMPSAQVTQAPGPLAPFAPWVQLLTGKQIPEALLQDFHLYPQTDGSQLFRVLIDQNTRNVKGLQGSATSTMYNRASALFGKDSLMAQMAPDLSRFLHGHISSPGDPIGALLAPMLDKAITALTGYDVGSSMNVVNAQSMGMATGMRALYGGAGTVGRMMDVLSSDFADTRAAVSSSLFSATQGLTWKRDPDGRILGRNKDVNGASESLVARILMDSLKNGDLGSSFESPALTTEKGNAFQGVKDALADFEGLQEELPEEQTFSNLMRTQETLVRRNRENAEELRNTGIQLSKAKAGGDTREIAKLEDEEKKLQEKGKAIAKAMDAVNRGIEEAGKDIVKAVTATVDSLKDLYGDEDKAAQALKALTNGRGMTNVDTAKTIKKAVDEYKLTAVAAGMDPRMAGQFLNSTVGNITSQWSTDLMTDNGMTGQLALALSTRAVRGAAGIRDERERNRFVNAYSGMAAEVGSSEGFKARAMYQYMVENEGRFGFAEGTGTRTEIEKLLKSSDTRNFARAKELIFSAYGRGSKAIGRETFEDEQAMAEIMEDITDKKSVADWTANKNVDELNRVMGTASRQSQQNEMATRLGEAGWTMTDLEPGLREADNTVIKGIIGENTTLSRYFAELEKADPRTAGAKFLATAKLTEEQRDAIYAASNKGRMDYMEGVGNATVDINTDDKTFFKDVGAVGASGKLNVLSLGESGRDLFKLLDGDKVLYADQEGLREKRTGFEKYLKSGNASEAAKIVADIYNKAEFKDVIKDSLGDREYRTDDVVKVDEKVREEWQGKVKAAREKIKTELSDLGKKSDLTKEDKQRKAALEEQLKQNELLEKATPEEARRILAQAQGALGGLDPDAWRTILKNVGAVRGTPLTGDEENDLSTGVEKVSEEAATAKEGLGENVFELLTGQTDITGFAEAVAGSKDALKELQATVMDLLRLLGVDIEPTGTTGSDSAGSSGSPDTVAPTADGATTTAVPSVDDVETPETVKAEASPTSVASVTPSLSLASGVSGLFGGLNLDKLGDTVGTMATKVDSLNTNLDELTIAINSNTAVQRGDGSAEAALPA